MKTVRVLEQEPPGSLVALYPTSPASFSTTSLISNAPKLAIAQRDKTRFQVSARSAEFLRRFYPDATVDNWNDWRWQNRRRIRTLADLQRMIVISDQEGEAIRRHFGSLPIGITPYYASLLDPQDESQALRKTVVPVLGEYNYTRGENADPPGEDAHSPVPGLVHRYPDRVLLLVTNFCSVYCRYCGRMADAGVPLGSQTVLLKGVNDNLETMKKLMHGLLQIRVKPYYLYQCDPISGSGHFRTPVSTGVELIRGLRGHTTGYAIPTFVVDAPSGGGKIPISPDYVVGYESGDLLLKSYDGGTYRYPDSGRPLPLADGVQP